jgi:hypothetical protein
VLACAVIEPSRVSLVPSSSILTQAGPCPLQYVVETKFVGEAEVAGGPTEVVGHESNVVDERIKQAPAGDRTVVVENVDVPASEVCY